MSKMKMFSWVLAAVAATSFAIGCSSGTDGDGDGDGTSSSGGSSGQQSSSGGTSSSGGGTSSSGGSDGTSSSGGQTQGDLELSEASITPNTAKKGERTELVFSFKYNAPNGLSQQVPLGLGGIVPQGAQQSDVAGSGNPTVTPTSETAGSVSMPFALTASVAGDYQFEIEMTDAAGVKAKTGFVTVTVTEE